MRQNLQTVSTGKLRRGCGWSKLLDGPNYNNADFHDQLLLYTGAFRQPPTMLFHAESSRRVNHLILGTQSTLARLKEVDGDYEVLGTGYGGVRSASAAAPRFVGAQVGDYVAFTNDFDKPIYYQLENSPVDNNPPLQTFPDLDTIGLTRAKLCWSWHDCLFFADVEMDGSRFSYRILWSNFQDPTSFDPAKLNSITGSKDLFSYERILGGRALGSSFLIYTTHGIWEMVVVGGEQSFDFARRFNGEDNLGQAVLKYPNTLVSLEDAHIYAAQDGLYIFSQYYGKPERLEWLHQSTPWIYDNIDEVNCQVPVAGFTVVQVSPNQKANELYISTASIGAANNCPDRTLRINMTYRVADVVDYGFTCFCNHQPQNIPSVRDFILNNGICTAEGLQTLGYGYGNEGIPKPIPTSTDAPTCFYTVQTAVVATDLAVGPTQVPTSVSRLAGIATMILTAHGFATGNRVRITGFASNSFNTDDVIITVVDPNTFTYPSPGPDVPAPVVNPMISVFGPAITGSVLVLTNGTATVSSPAHGLTTGNNVQVVGDGSSVINSNGVAIVVTDVDTFTYATTAQITDTAPGAPGVNNVIPLNAHYSYSRYPQLGFLTGVTTNLHYFYTQGANEFDLHAAHVIYNASTSFKYDGLGLYLAGALGAGSHGPPVTAFITSGIAASIQTFSSSFAPNSIVRTDPSTVTVTKTAHGLTTGQVISASGMADVTMNIRAAAITVIDANTFTYQAPAIIQNPQVFLLTPENILSEDLNHQPADPASLCTQLGNETIDDTCARCQGTTLLIAASSQDLCLKQIGGVFYRERCVNPNAVGTVSPIGYSSAPGSYLLDGYDSIWRFSPMFIEGAEAPELQVEMVRLDFIAVPQNPPSNVGLRVGIAAQPADPNTSDAIAQQTGESRFVWFQHSLKPFRNPSQKTSVQHLQSGTIPSQYLKWDLLRKGRSLAIELTLGGTGGDGEFTRIIASVKESETTKF